MKLSLELDVQNIDGNKSLNDILSTLTLEDKKELAKSIYTKVLTDYDTLTSSYKVLANEEIQKRSLKNEWEKQKVFDNYRNEAVNTRKEILNNFIQFVAKDFKEEFEKEIYINFIKELQEELKKNISKITSDTYSKLLGEIIVSAFNNSQMNTMQIPWLQDTVNKISQSLIVKGI